MKLPEDSVISERKIREYLLLPRIEDDKSGFLALAGYRLDNWGQLVADLRRQIKEKDALLIRTTQYGDIYEIRDSLTGPNGKALNVITVWIRLLANGETRFVTLIPGKEARK
jgi:hypothetical protein